MAKFTLFIYFIILINLVMFATTGIYYENESIVKFSKLFYSFSFEGNSKFKPGEAFNFKFAQLKIKGFQSKKNK